MNKLFNLLLFLICLGIKINSVDQISDKEIQEIYDLYVKPNLNDSYMLRYVPLPIEKNNKSWNWKGKDLARIIPILEFERFIKDNNISCKKGLAINGPDAEWEYLEANKVVIIDYVDNPDKYNLHSLNLDEKDFDFVTVNQTLEHVYDPIKCLKNIYSHMLKGGILYFNVPANNIPHSTPFHFYTGFTPVGIGAIVKLAGFEILSIGQWGNLEYLIKMNQMRYWPDYLQFQNPGFNDPNYPISTWIFARK